MAQWFLWEESKGGCDKAEWSESEAGAKTSEKAEENSQGWSGDIRWKNEVWEEKKGKKL